MSACGELYVGRPANGEPANAASPHGVGSAGHRPGAVCEDIAPHRARVLDHGERELPAGQIERVLALRLALAALPRRERDRGAGDHISPTAGHMAVPRELDLARGGGTE